MKKRKVNNTLGIFRVLQYRGILREAKLSAIFLIYFIISFALFNLVFLLLNLDYYTGFYIAGIMKALLGGEVKTATVENKELAALQIGPSEIVFSSLCTGLLELSVLVSAIIASRGIKIKKRIIGVAFATLTVFVFNIMRIYITISFILSQNLNEAEILHNILFKSFLFVVIVGFYFLWFKWSTESEKRCKE